jgi:nitroreductase
MKTSDLGADRRAAINLLLSRHSVSPKFLVAPSPSDDELLVLAGAALRAPDHGKLTPFRLVAISGAALERLADVFEDYGRRRGKSDSEVALERIRATQAPLVIAVLARIDTSRTDVPAHEQWACVGGAIANVLNALHFMGYAGKMLSGERVSDEAISHAFCADGESLVGWISAGTASAAPPPRSTLKPNEILSHVHSHAGEAFRRISTTG